VQGQAEILKFNAAMRGVAADFGFEILNNFNVTQNVQVVPDFWGF
jgi:hypothetical protein